MPSGGPNKNCLALYHTLFPLEPAKDALYYVNSLETALFDRKYLKSKNMAKYRWSVRPSRAVAALSSQMGC